MSSSYTVKVWTSKNNNWELRDFVRSYRDEKTGQQRYKTTLYIECTRDGYQDFPILYADYTAAYDNDLRIPQYVKEEWYKRAKARRVAREKLLRDSEIVGYYNWCDTICYDCKISKNIDTAGFATITMRNAITDDGYWCDYCGKEFPQSVIDLRQEKVRG